MAVNLRIAGAAGLVVLGAIGAGVVGQLPAFGEAPAGVVATPSSAAQSLVCPGPTIAVGADSANAAALTATGRPSRVIGTVGGTKPTSTALGRGQVKGGAAPRVLAAPAATDAGAIAGAQLEQVTTGDAAGLAATACSAPRSDVWFAAGATTTGRTTVLTLANASAVAAQVRVRVWSENGPVDAASFSDLVIPAEGRRAVSLAGVAPSAGGLVVRVTSSGGLVGAALEQRTVRGLESGGVDLVVPTAEPATAQVVPGVRVAGAAAVASAARADDFADLQTVVRVLVPGATASDVSITATPDAGGQPVTVGRRVAAGVVTDFPVTGLVDGTYTVRVSADRPLVTGVRTSVVGDAGAPTTPDDTATGGSAPTGADAPVGTDAGLVGGDGPADTSSAAVGGSTSVGPTSTARGIDLAWFAAAPELTRTVAVAVVAAPSPVLTIAGTGTARSVTISGATDQTVEVPAKGAVAVPVASGVLVLKGVDGLHAGVSFAGAGAVAGYPVAGADQEARGIRISR